MSREPRREPSGLAPVPSPARWDLLGLAAGLCFSALAVALVLAEHGDGVSAAALLEAHRSARVLWLTDLAPLALGAIGLAVRRSQRALMAAVAASADAQREAAGRLAGQLSAAAHDLTARVSSILAACTQTATTVGETADTVQRLSGTATAAALEAETVIGIALRSERASESAGSLADSTSTELSSLAGDVRVMSDQIEELHLNVKHLLDITCTMAWLAQRSQVLATTAVKAALAGDVEAFHCVAGDMRSHADDALWAARQAEVLITEVKDEMARALEQAEAGGQRAARGAEVVQRTSGKIRDLGVALRDSASAARNIAQTAQQQGGAFDRVLTAMNEIWFATESNVQATQAVAESARELDALAASLRRAVGAPGEPTPIPGALAAVAPAAAPPAPAAADAGPQLHAI